MNDLHDLMNRTSDGDPNRAADPMTLLSHGRRRVRRRRGVTAVSGVAVASLAVAGAAAWLPHTTPTSPGPDQSQPPVATTTSDGAYEPVEVSREEVGKRCTTLFHNAYGSDGTYVVPSFGDDDGPWFEGQTAQVSEANPDEGRWRWTASCEIPQADLVEQAGTLPASLPDPSDPDGVRAACGQFLGWDFMGWEVVTAAGTDIATAAALRSTNGYVATCMLSAAPGQQGDGSYVAIEREQPPSTDSEGLENEYAVWFNTDQYAGDKVEGDYNVFGVDQISGPQDAAQIVITEPDGTEHVTEVADNGWFALADDLHLEMNPHGVSPLRIKVLDADGNVLADYPDGEQSKECDVHPDLCVGPKD
jgi:hypothetical protein